MTDTAATLHSNSALDVVPASLAVLDQHGFIVEVNRAWKQFGEANGLVLPDSGVGINYLRLCLTSEDPHAQEAARGIRQVLSGKAESHLQVYPCHAPDQERWFQLRVTRIPDSGHVMVAHENVTDLKLTEQALEHQVEFVRGLVASSPDCIKVLNLDGTVLWMNEGGRVLMEIDLFEAVGGRPWAAFWPQEHHQNLKQALEAARRGTPGRFQGYCPTAKGTQKFWDVVVTPIPGTDGQPLYLLASSRDLTALRKAEEVALHRAEETTRILNSIQEGFFALDREWRFTYLNARAEVLLRRHAADLLGRCVWEAFPHALQGSFAPRYQAVISEQRSVCFQEYHAPLNMWFEMNAYPHGQGVAVYFQNITTRKAEEQAQQDRNAILEAVVQGKALPEVLNQIALMVERQFPGHHCTILLEQEGQLNLAAAPGLPEAFHPVLSGIEVREGAGICGTAVARRETVVSEDLLADPSAALYLRQLPPNELRACVSLPILDGDGRPLGALALYATTPGPFSAQTLKTLDKARHLAAVALEHHRLTKRLVHQAHHDRLTGLANRQLFEVKLQEALQRSEQTGLPTSLLFIDLDDFKTVNDNLGHQVGDRVLECLAERFKQSVRPQDTLARISGDEFTIVMPTAGEEEAHAAAQRLLEAVAAPLVLQGRELHLRASIGISVTPEGGRDAETMQQSADFAMYEAKKRKTGSFLFRSTLADQASRRFELGTYLRRATEFGELELHYQPIVQLENQHVVGAEALLRWRHPELGLVSPAEFIPIAEETGLIVPIGEWVLREACRQGVTWMQQGRPLRLAVNVSALQFERPDFVDTVAACLQDTGFPAQNLELELTERVVMRHAEEAAERMHQLRELGVSIAVDDFGTGYSSLSYLSRFPLNVLKIDRSFVSQLPARSSSSPVVKAIITLAQSLGLDTVAEGVESPAEAELLKQMGCHLAQGYLFARPRPATDPFWQQEAGSPAS